MIEERKLNEAVNARESIEHLSGELKAVLMSINKAIDVLEYAGVSGNAISEYHEAEARIVALIEWINQEAKMATMMNCVYAPPEFFGSGEKLV